MGGGTCVGDDGSGSEGMVGVGWGDVDGKVEIGVSGGELYSLRMIVAKMSGRGRCEGLQDLSRRLAVREN